MHKAIKVWEELLPENHPNLVNSKKGLEVIESMLKK